MLTIFCEGLRPRLTPRRLGAFDFGCSPQRANKNAPPNGVCTARQACALGCEGIVSKRLGSAYRSGRADCWLEVKNPKCARGHARGRRGLELLSHGSARSMRPRRLPEPPFRRIASPLMQPSPIGRRVGTGIVTFEDPRHHAGNPGIGTPDVCRIRITLSSNTTAVATIAAILVSRPLAN